MKHLKLNITYLLIALMAVFSLNSCDKNDPDPEESGKYYISSEVKSNITTQQAISSFTKLSPEAAFGLGFVIKSDVEVRKLTYKTTFQDKNILASGLVCLPKIPGNYPVFSFQNGTNTMHNEAPSESADDDLFSLIGSIAAMGYIVVIPDYIGFGASSNLPHPYLYAKSSNQCILDFIRATKELCLKDEIVAKSTKDLFIFGYSQGGWATLGLQKEIETNYSSEFNLIASSCGAGPYSLEFMNSYISGLTNYPTPYFLAYLLNAYKTIGLITNPLSDYFNESYASIIPGLFDGKHTGGSINAALTPNIGNLLKNDYLTKFNTEAKYTSLKTAFVANSIEAWDIKTPTRLYHGADDAVIPLSISQKMFADIKTKMKPGSTVEIKLITIPNAEHTSGVYQTGLETILWFLSLKK